MADSLKDLEGQIKTKREAIAAIFASGPLEDLPREKLEEVKSLNDALNDICPKAEALKAADKLKHENSEALKSLNAPSRPHFGGWDGAGVEDMQSYGSRNAIKSVGDLFIENDSYKAWQGERKANRKAALDVYLDMDIKTLFATSAGWAPFVQRLPGYITSAQQQPVIADLIPMFETTNNSIKWMLETTYTNNAAETSENGTYPESAFALTEQTTPVNKVAVTLPATDEQLEDVPGARDYIQSRLTLGLRQRLDRQLLLGDASAPNFRGMTNLTNKQTQAKGSLSDFDALLQGINKVANTAFANPNVILMNPTDWTNLRSIRSAGWYLLGNPGDAVSPRVWGLPIVTSTYLTATNAIVTDTMYHELHYRRGITFDTTNSHASEFLNGVQRIRASFRAAYVVTRESAVCQVTGLAGT